MTIKIEVEVPADMVLNDRAGRYLDRALSALGYARSVSSVSQAAHDAAVTGIGYMQMDDRGNVERIDPKDVVMPTATEVGGKPLEAVEHEIEAPAPTLDTRPVGSPSEGNKRRNSAEKAEDDEFEKLATDRGVALDKLNAGIAQVGRAEARHQIEALDVADKQTADEPKAAISTGEERIGPDDEQDAADEAAETAKTGLAPIDVLRRLVGDYQKKHGMPKAVALCQDGGLIGKPIHELDDAGIEAAIAAMQGGEPAAAEEPAQQEEPAKLEPKTKADLVEAMMRYADKFDGTRDQSQMKATLEDCPRIFVSVFGDSVTKLSQVPEDGYARAVAAIDEAIATDPFGRAK